MCVDPLDGEAALGRRSGERADGRAAAFPHRQVDLCLPAPLDLDKQQIRSCPSPFSGDVNRAWMDNRQHIICAEVVIIPDEGIHQKTTPCVMCHVPCRGCVPCAVCRG